MKSTKLNLLLTAIIVSVALVSCSQYDDRVTSSEIVEYLKTLEYDFSENDGNGGNLTCDAVAAYFADINGEPVKFNMTTGKVDYDADNNEFKGTWPEWLEVNVVDGIFVDFSVTDGAPYCIGAVIVKGGPDASVYYFADGIKSYQALSAPVNPSNDKPYGLSNLTFCFFECESSELCWKAETAFGGETAGAGSAWWFAFDTQGDMIQKIYAGQKEVPGAAVEYDEVNDVITIVFGDNIKLQEPVEVTKQHPKTKVWTTSYDSEQVKVQGYNELPASRPSAGLFTLYKGRDLVIQGNGSRYYVIHLDVEVNDCE